MDEVIEQAELLKRMIENRRREIDNPVLTTGMIAELEFFIDNVREEE